MHEHDVANSQPDTSKRYSKLARRTYQLVHDKPQEALPKNFDCLMLRAQLDAKFALKGAPLCVALWSALTCFHARLVADTAGLKAHTRHVAGHALA